MSWHATSVSSDRTHHTIGDRPLYAARFQEVLPFHDPGLAPAADRDGATHIDIAGQAVYSHRFLRTFGFYEGRAAVTTEDGWTHIGGHGDPLYTERYAWCGNYQGRRCAVRAEDGSYFHIDVNGGAAYAHRYAYVGDYREGVAVARRVTDGLCHHIDPNGNAVHPLGVTDLDVFHKGLARARDDRGWHHVDRRGLPAYDERFSDVEPFYNGSALAWTRAGRVVVIDERGEIQHRVWPQVDALATGKARRLLVLGNIGAGKSTLVSALAQRLGWKSCSIDESRRRHGDGTPAGELRSWAAFVDAASGAGPLLLECSGIGPQVPLLRLALKSGAGGVGVIYVRTPPSLCSARASGRPLPPYPNFGVPVQRTILDLDVRLEESRASGGLWSREWIGDVDGTAAVDSVLEQAVQLIERWQRSVSLCSI